MLLRIPLQSVPNQVLTVFLNGQQVTIELSQNSIDNGITNNIYANIYVASTQLYNNAKCNNLCYINQYQDIFVGYLFFASDDDSEPDYNNFGITCKLYYADYDILEQYYQDWIITNKNLLDA
jgi:hypothetical protein